MTHKTLCFIGDIHGKADKLDALLPHIDFIPEAYPEGMFCKLVFLGDLIDNKPGEDIDHLRLLQRVKALCEAGDADCLLGNHEFNAVGWLMRHPQTGLPLRAHDESNTRQHEVFLQQVTENSDQHIAWINWFKRLPLFRDYGYIRAVHACWDDDKIARLRPYLNDDNSLKEEFWVAAFDETHELYALCEHVLKGPEIPLPAGYSFRDKHGKTRTQIRVRWWLESATTYREVAQVPPAQTARLPDVPLPAALRNPEQEVPVVVGHYTLNDLPQPLSYRVICVDYNAAGGGPLVAYMCYPDKEYPEVESDRHFPHEQHFMSPELPEYTREGGNALYQIFNEVIARFPMPVLPETAEQDLTRRINEILLRNWDPVGVYGVEECENEYYGYIEDVMRLALAGQFPTISAYLIVMSSTAMGCPVDDEQCDRIALRIRQTMDEWRRAHFASAEVIPLVRPAAPVPACGGEGI